MVGAGPRRRWSVAGLLVLLQWPLAAALLPALRRGHAFAGELIGFSLVALGAALWTLFSSRSGASWGLLPGAGLMTLGAFLCFRNDSLLIFNLVAAALWILSSLMLAQRRSELAGRIALSVGAIFLGLLAAEPLLGRLDGSAGPAGKRVAGISRGRLGGQVEIADREATGQLLPMSRAHAWKARGDGGVEFDVVYRVDRFGSRRVAARPEQGPTWMLFGGSFTFGEGLEDEETIANRLQLLMPGARLYNFGVRGSGTGDVLLLLRRKLASGEPPAGVIYFFIEDHIRRAALPDRTVAEQGYRPRFRLVDGEPVHLGKAESTIPTRAEELHLNLLRRSALYRRLGGDWAPTGESLDLVAALVGAIRTEVERAEGRFLFVLLPQREVRWPERVAELGARLEEMGICVLDCRAPMTRHLQTTGEPESAYFFADGHPNAGYADLVARWVDARLEELGWSEPERRGPAAL